MKNIILMPNGYTNKKGFRKVTIKELYEIVTGSDLMDPIYSNFRSDLVKMSKSLKDWMNKENFDKLKATEEQESIYLKYKQRLPCYIAGASEVNEGDSPSILCENVKELSDLFMVDIDITEDFNPQNKDFKEMLKSLHECRYFANSPTGVRMIIEYYVQDEDLKKSNYNEIFKHLFDNLRSRYLTSFGFDIDSGCQNVDRKGIIIADKEAFYKETGSPFVLYKSEFVERRNERKQSEEAKLINSKPPKEVLEIFANSIRKIDDEKANKIMRMSRFVGGLYAGKGFEGQEKEEIIQTLIDACKDNSERDSDKRIKDLKHAERIVRGAFKDGEKDPIKPKKGNGLRVFKLRDFLNQSFPENEPLMCGYPMFDKYHLIKRGCITTLLGASGSRKSTFLINLTTRLAQRGYKILYVIIEGNIRRNVHAIVAQSNFIAMNDVSIEHFNNDIFDNITIACHNYGFVKVDDIKAQCKDDKYDAIVLDYVTLLSEDEQNIFLKGQMISQKLKNVAEEFNLGVLTANQSNKPAMNKIQLDPEDVGESHGITMAMDVMLGIIKYIRLEEVNRTALEIIKIRDIPDEVVKESQEPVEGKREFYNIDFSNKMITHIDNSDDLNKRVKNDINLSNNDKRVLVRSIEETKAKTTITSTEVVPITQEEEINNLFNS